MNTQAKVALDKEKHPERYCPKQRCLWRTGGGYCPRHKPAEERGFDVGAQNDSRFGGTLDETGE